MDYDEKEHQKFEKGYDFMMTSKEKIDTVDQKHNPSSQVYLRWQAAINRKLGQKGLVLLLLIQM